VISAIADSDITQVAFYADGAALQTLSAPPYQTWWMLSEGEHRFWAEGTRVNGEIEKSSVITIVVTK